MKIVLIVIYIGEFPWYFSYFLHSCRYNPSIDFFIYTDNLGIETMDIPDNVKFFNYTLSIFNQEASKALNLEIEVRNSYKLCDFKPTYGTIFYNRIIEYDFWGYCDIDIIWGDIRLFMTEELLGEYDIISARHDYLTGCFALYRNNESMRTLFKQSKDYVKVFLSKEYSFFDETSLGFEGFGKGLHYSLIKTEVESMTHVVRKLEELGIIRPYFEFQIIEGLAGNMIWDNGILTYRRKFESMCYHMIKFKHIYSEELDLLKKIQNRFRIGRKRIY